MTEAYSGWALVEQMGFRQTIAKIYEVEQYGTKMLALDVPFFDKPEGDPAGYTTRFADGPSLYQVTPMLEELALAQARKQADPRPVQPMGYRLTHAALVDHAPDENAQVYDDE